jgi:hypothetical protein
LLNLLFPITPFAPTPIPTCCFVSRQEEHTHTTPLLSLLASAFAYRCSLFALESARSVFSVFSLKLLRRRCWFYSHFPSVPWLDGGKEWQEFVQLTLLLEEREKQNEGIFYRVKNARS